MRPSGPTQTAADHLKPPGTKVTCQRRADADARAADVSPGLGGVCGSVAAEAGASVTVTVNLQQLGIRICFQLPGGISAGSPEEHVQNRPTSTIGHQAISQHVESRK